MYVTFWNNWIMNNWDALVSGGKIILTSSIPHPAHSGFIQEYTAEKVGQWRDWVLPLSDGSRIHVHEFIDGRMAIHRDRWDPNQNFSNLVKHIAFETTTGRLAIAGLLVFGFAHLARRA